jgi:hypothetical protein
MDEAKPFLIPKRELWEAFKRVKANQGAAGVDGQSVKSYCFESEDGTVKQQVSGYAPRRPRLLRQFCSEAAPNEEATGSPQVPQR